MKVLLYVPAACLLLAFCLDPEIGLYLHHSQQTASAQVPSLQSPVSSFSPADLSFKLWVNPS